MTQHDTRRTSRPARTSPGPLLWLGAILLLVALSGPQHYRNAIHTANESARVYAAEALVDYHSPALDPVFDRYFVGWRAHHRPPNLDVSFRAGRYLLDKAPGVTLAALPVVALLRLLGIHLSFRQLTWLLALLLSALPTVLALVWLRRWLSAEMDPVSATIPIALALASPWTVYAGLLFGHALAAALVTVGVALCLGPMQAGGPVPTTQPTGAERGGSRALLGRWWCSLPWLAPLFGGLTLGAAVLADYPAAWVVLVVLVALLADPSRRSRLAPVVLGGLVPAAALAIWNLALFGHPLHFSYAYKWNPRLAATHGHGMLGIGLPAWEGLWGLLLSSRRGLLHWSPWLGIGVVGALWAGLDRHLGRSWRLVLAVTPLGALLLISGFPDWHGGRAVGPRYLLFVLPLWAMGAAWLGHRVRPGRARAYGLAVFVGLLASSALLSWITATGYPYVSHRVANPLFEVVLPVLERDGFGTTVWDGLIPRPAGAVLTLACAGAAAALLWPRQSPHARSASSAAGTLPQATAGSPAPTSARIARWRLGLVAFAATVLHLAVASLPVTSGAEGRQRVQYERALAREVLNLEKGPKHPSRPGRRARPTGALQARPAGPKH